MRKYCLGAFLLDLNDPARVIGRLREPLLSPNGIGARRLCSERRLHLWRIAARTRTHHPLRDERLRHQLRHRFTGCTARRDGIENPPVGLHPIAAGSVAGLIENCSKRGLNPETNTAFDWLEASVIVNPFLLDVETATLTIRANMKPRL